MNGNMNVKLMKDLSSGTKYRCRLLQICLPSSP